MSKAILVTDMPSSCSECELQDMCLKNKGCIPFYKRDEECPLKEVPEKKLCEKGDSYYRLTTKMGYNACIDEILWGCE